MEVTNSSSSSQRQSKGLHRSPKKGRCLSAKRGRAAADDSTFSRKKKKHIGKRQHWEGNFVKIKDTNIEQVVRNAFVQESFASWPGFGFAGRQRAGIGLGVYQILTYF